MNALGCCWVCGAPAAGIREPGCRPVRLCAVHIAAHDAAEAVVRDLAKQDRSERRDSNRRALTGAGRKHGH